MTAALTTIAPVIKINGALASDLVLQQLDGLRISRALGLPGRAVLKFADIGYSVAAGQVFGIGTEVAIDSPAGTSMFLGEVTGVEMLLDRGQPELTRDRRRPRLQDDAGHQGAHLHQGQLFRGDLANRPRIRAAE